MRFLPTSEEDALRDAVRAFAKTEASARDHRGRTDPATSDPTFDRELWSAMTGQLGIGGLGLPEAMGGAGGSLVDVCVVMEELGYVLLRTPYLANSVLAARVLALAGAERELITTVVSGARTATVAVVNDDTRDVAPLTARRVGSRQWVVSGNAGPVIDGASADLMLVNVANGDGSDLFGIDLDQPGVVTVALQGIDPTRPLARIQLDEALAVPVAEGQTAAFAWTRGIEEARIALAAEQLGAARRGLEMSVEYAKVRIQFGRPIGSFQAVKHRCADMLIALESARATVDFASRYAVEHPSGDLAVVASLAALRTSRAFVEIAAGTIQVHGGMGFTWEHPAHHYLRRAKLTQQLLGGPDFHTRRLAREMRVDDPVAYA